MSVKTPIDHYLSQSSSQQHRPCDRLGCSQTGIHRAPQDRKKVNQFFFFCLYHIQEYNKNWNYYKDMSEDEAYQSRLRDYYGERPTWPMGSRFNPLIHNFDNLFSAVTLNDRIKSSNRKPSHQSPSLSLTSQHREALAVLDISWPVTLRDLKRHYKILAKKYHPDLNFDTPQSNEHFKKINRAYQIAQTIFSDHKPK